MIENILPSQIGETLVRYSLELFSMLTGSALGTIKLFRATMHVDANKFSIVKCLHGKCKKGR